MSILTKKEITSFLNQKKIVFAPMIDKFQLQPHAIDLRLGFEFFIPHHWQLNQAGRCALNIDYLQIDNPKAYESITLKPKQYFEVLPQETIVAKTLENISINTGEIMAVMYPRSSLNRRGLSVDLTGIVDSMYSGYLIIPIKNNTHQIIRLYPGERICSLVFESLSTKLAPHDTQLHGVNPAKYSHKDWTKFKKDDFESEFLKNGDINALKQQYPL